MTPPWRCGESTDSLIAWRGELNQGRTVFAQSAALDFLKGYDDQALKCIYSSRGSGQYRLEDVRTLYPIEDASITALVVQARYQEWLHHPSPECAYPNRSTFQKCRGAIPINTAFSFFPALPNGIIINSRAKPTQSLPCRAQRGNPKGAMCKLTFAGCIGCCGDLIHIEFHVLHPTQKRALRVETADR